MWCQGTGQSAQGPRRQTAYVPVRKSLDGVTRSGWEADALCKWKTRDDLAEIGNGQVRNGAERRQAA